MKIKTLMATLLAMTMFGSLVSCGEAKPEELSYISGTVFEKTTKAPLPDVKVILGDQSITTTTDGRFIFSKLEKGSKHVIEAFRSSYKDYKITDVVAVFPGVTQDIEMEIETSDPPSVSPVNSTSTLKLKSFDYVFSFGTSPAQITYEMSGSFSAPDRYSHSMKQFRQQQIQVGPDDAKKESPPLKLIEISGKQWVDEGNGYVPVDPKMPREGFRDMFGYIEYYCTVLTKALNNAKNIKDNGEAKIGGIACRRYSGVVVMDLMRTVYGESGKTQVKDTVLCDFSVALATDPVYFNAPVDLEMMLYYKDLQSRPYAHYTLSNLNNPIVIKEPDVKGPDTNIKITP